jgi:hypothetical protein
VVGSVSRGRFKTLEIPRKAAFTVGVDCLEGGNEIGVCRVPGKD